MPREETLFSIYLEMSYDDFCEFDGISGEGRALALREWRRRNGRN